MIEVEGLTKLYDEFVAVQELSFAVRPGEILGLVGPNGAGKTTTLRCLAGIIPATRGSVRIAGHDVAAAGDLAARRVRPRRRGTRGGHPAGRLCARCRRHGHVIGVLRNTPPSAFPFVNRGPG